MAKSETSEFTPLNIAVLTVSDTRDASTDTSGDYFETALKEAGHRLADRQIVKDDCYAIRAVVSQWIYQADVHAVLITGGTGFSGRDSTPESVMPLLDKVVDGFGELFRYLSWQEIGTSTLQSRAVAGLSNNTVVFSVPGSTGACRTAWEGIIAEQLNSQHRPCNFVATLLGTHH
jgi:molybdenum cofactor biosynthesis protein B